MSARILRLCSFILLVSLKNIGDTATTPFDLHNGLMLSNAAKLGDTPQIDPRFSIMSEYGWPVLPGIPCLFNAVHAMQDLALEDFEEPLVPIPYMLDNFPEVMITPKATAAGGAIQTRFIVWGLWIGIVAMIERRSFQTATITLKYEGTTVGYLNIAQPGAQLSAIGSNNTGTLNQKSIDVRHHFGTPTITTWGTNGDTSEKLTVSFQPIGPPLIAKDILLAILYGLVFTAHFPSAQRAEPFVIRLPSPYYMHIQVSAAKAGSTTTTPSLEYRWIINSLSQIPQYMLERKRFSGVSWRMKVDGVIVGDGLIMKTT